MKKKSLLCWGLIGCLSLVGCAEEKFAYNETYTYSHVAFFRSERVTIEDLASFIPAGAQISSVEELENLIKQSLDTYSIVKNEDGQQKRIYLKNELQSITFLESEQATVVYKGESHTVRANAAVGYEQERFIVGNAYETKLFYYEDGYVYYSISIADGFAIEYIFEND